MKRNGLIVIFLVAILILLTAYLPASTDVKILKLTENGRELCSPGLLWEKCEPFCPRPTLHFKMSGGHFKTCWLPIGPKEYVFNQQCRSF
jgi:hypothetical protein